MEKRAKQINFSAGEKNPSRTGEGDVNYPPPAYAEVGASRSEYSTSLFYPAMPAAPTR